MSVDWAKRGRPRRVPLLCVRVSQAGGEEEIIVPKHIVGSVEALWTAVRARCPDVGDASHTFVAPSLDNKMLQTDAELACALDDEACVELAVRPRAAAPATAGGGPAAEASAAPAGPMAGLDQKGKGKGKGVPVKPNTLYNPFKPITMYNPK